MKQLQEVQTKALERRSTAEPEAVKPGVTALPELKPPTPETAPVEVQDWLQLLAAPMSDLSDSSGEWWAKIQDLAQQGYQEWSDATPLERLSLRPPRKKELEEGKYARLNSRASSMLVASLDPQVRADLVTRRCTSSASQILFRVLTLYQPGGEAEKRLVIEQLQNGTTQPDAPKAAEALRNWERWHRRAADVGVATPDPTILGRALTGIMKKVLEAHPEAAFRTSLLRNSPKLDTRPTDETIHAYHKHLLAEAEALTTGAPRSTTSSTPTTEATRTSSADKPTRLKGLQAHAEVEQTPKAKAAPAPNSTSASPKLCRWFAKSEAGCKRGADCQFLHDWQGVSKSGRCLVCSGTGHQKKDCPTKDKNAQAQSSRTRQREQSTTSQATPPANKALSANQEPTSPSSQPASEPSPTSSTVKGTTQPETPQQDELKQVIADASKMIKSMMAQSSASTPAASSGSTPSYESIQRQLDELKLRAMKVGAKAEEVVEERGVLLDSGSTHILRPPANDGELEASKPVAVTLASDEHKVMHQCPAGSLIVQSEQGTPSPQSIIPFGKVIEVLGCTLRWTKGGLYLHHPRHGRIRTRVRAGCPEITDAGQAAQIIAELEMKRVEELKQRTEQLQDQLDAVRMLEVRDADWRILMAGYAEEGSASKGLQALYKAPMFKDLPDSIRFSMAPAMDISAKAGWEYLKMLPVPRRVRKRLFKSRTWILNMFAGAHKKHDPIQILSGVSSSQVPGEVVVVNVDAMMDAGWNLQGEAYKALVWGAVNSKVKAVIGSPPSKGLEAMREGWGTNVHDARYHKELEILAKQLFLFLLSYTANDGLEPALAIGAPSDREGVWSTTTVQQFEKAVRDIGVSRVDLEQGSLGHPIKAATRLLQNIGLDYLNGERDSRKEVGDRGGEGISGEKWCPGLRRAILDGIRSKGIGDGRDQSESDASMELKKLSKEQGWKLHIARDHIPFRRDCEQCVMTLGTGRPHRRTKQKSAYVLSVDVGGPMRVKSKDAHGSGYKFFLAGAYTKPRFDDVEPPKEPDPEDLASLEYDFADLVLEPAALVPTGNDLADLELDPVLPPSEHLSEYEPSLPEEDDSPEIFKVTAAEGLWNDDEKAEDQQREEADETEAVEGNRAIPMDHLYFVKPLKSKSGKHVKMAIQEIVMQLRHENLPVVRIHSDRAHEMRSVALREWALNNNILLTRTEGQSPQGNGTAERAVRFMKGQARKLLRAAELDTSFWATAMLTAAHHQRESVLQPETYEPPCPYGSRVAIKRKVYGQGGRLDLIPRWTKGIYLGPVWDVGKGSAVLDETSKRITVTTHIRPNLRNAESVAERPVQEFEPPVRRRLRAKVPVDEDGVQVKRLKKYAPDKARKTLEKEILAEIDALGFKMNVKRPQLREQEGTLDEEGYTTVGAYQHGGKHGVTNFTKEHPDLTAKITQLFEMVFPEELFTSVTIVKNTKMPLHRDVFNDKRTKNLVIPLEVTSDAGIWEELRPGDQFQGNYIELEVNGKDTPGQVHSLRKEARINPSRWHCAVQEQGGRRVLLAAHTIGSWKKLVADDVKTLDDLGFQVPEEDAEEVAAMRAVCEVNKETETYEYAVDEDELVRDFSGGDPTVEVDEEIRLCAKAAAENLYTYNIEGVLEDLRGADLRVVHTVHQKEVEQNLPKWVSALAAEVTALETIGAVKRRRGKDAKAYLQSPGVTIVPGKAVFTVKPPSKEGEQYRRKARIVSCGNFQPKNNQEENYSGGAAAESVSLGVAEAARRRWWLCNGDISNAFFASPCAKGHPACSTTALGLGEGRAG